MAITATSVLWPSPQDNMGGIQQTAYYALLEDFDNNSPVPQKTLTAATTFADLAAIPTQHVFLPTKSWKKLYSSRDVGVLEDEPVGEIDGRSFTNRGRIFIPGAKADAIGFARYANNANLIFVFKDAESLKRQVGSRQYPAKVVPGSMTTGEGPQGLKGYTLVVEAPSNGPAPIYDFALPIEDGSGSE